MLNCGVVALICTIPFSALLVSLAVLVQCAEAIGTEIDLVRRRHADQCQTRALL